jgi:hypothetical protein
VVTRPARLNLPQSLITSHLDPGLSADADLPALGINGVQKFQREIYADELFDRVLAGEVLRYVVALFGLFGNFFYAR